MQKPNYNIINIISLFTSKIHFYLLIIFIILANCEEIPKIIKFKRDGKILIYDTKNNDTIFNYLYFPLISIKTDEKNINFNDNNILLGENGDFTYVVPGQDVSIINFSFEEFTLNSHLLLKKYPNLLFNTNKTFSLFSINIINGYLSKYENYKSKFIEENNFKFIKQICPNDKNDILFLRIDYFIKMRYTYEFKDNIKNNDVIWNSHFIKIIPIYPEIILQNSDIYDINKNKNYYEEDDFYIFQINENEKISILYSQDKDLYAEITDIKNDFNFNNYYFGNKKRNKLFQDAILIKEENKKFPKRFLIAFISLLLIIIFIKIKSKENRKTVKFEIKTNKLNIDLKENNEIKNKNEKVPSPKAKSITNLNIYFGLENKNKNNLLKNIKKKASYYKYPNSSKKRDLLSLKKMTIRKSITNYKKKKTATLEEKNILNQLFNTYLEDIKNNNNNNDSTVNLNLNIKTISIADKYKKLYSLLDVENDSEQSKKDYKENKINKINRENQNILKKEFQNNFNYFIDSGRLLKEFKDFEFIGKGGFGVVLKASNILDEGQWAIKIMRINLDLRKAKELNAIQEIKMMSKFKKKNIVRYKTCWFEFAQNTPIKKRERAASFDDNKEDSKINEQKAQENKQVIFEKLSIKVNKRKNTVICDRSKDNNIIYLDEEIKTEKKENKKIKQKERKRVIKPEKRRTSNIWDDDDEDLSDDSLGADKNYIIREEGKNINLDDKDSFNEDTSEEEEEEEDEESSSFEENKDIIKEEKTNNNNNDSLSSGYDGLRYENKNSNFRENESSSNLIDTNSNNTNSKKKEEEIHNNNNKKNDSKFIIYFFIQMEYCSGCPMNYYLSHRKSVPSKSLTSYMFFQMCYAVKHIHEANIIHRDLKPGNIFIMNDYLIKIGDFGLALNFGKTKNEQGGTYLYQSPEQIQNKIYDQKVDIFALGVILVELVSKFDTEYERVEVLQGLKNDLYPNYLEKEHLNEFNLIKKMTRLNADERPNIQDIFSDPDFIALSNSH